MNNLSNFPLPDQSSSGLSPNIPLDFALQSTSTIHTQLSRLQQELLIISSQFAKGAPIHPFSSSPPPPQAAFNAQFAAISVAIQSYQATFSELLNPMNGSPPMVVGANKLVASLRENAVYLERLEERKRGIRQVMDIIKDGERKLGKGNPLRNDPGLREESIETLAREFGYVAHFFLIPLRVFLANWKITGPAR
jgi:hypothetical protein